MNALIGKAMGPVSTGAEHPPQVDIVSGATVTILVMADSVIRSAVRLIRSGRLGDRSGARDGGARPPSVKSVDLAKSDIRDWEFLLGDGSVRHLQLTIGEINEAFAKSGNQAAAANPEPGDPNETFIDLYVAPVTVPTIGRSLLGDDGYEQLKARLKPGQQAVVVAGDGVYSFKGSGYVRGGIFDRIELLQDGSSTRFRDRNHTRLGNLAAEGAPELREIGLFVTPEDFTLQLTDPWQLQLLVQRAVATRDKAFIPFEVLYTLPERTYITARRSDVASSDQASARSEAHAAPSTPSLQRC